MRPTPSGPLVLAALFSVACLVPGGRASRQAARLADPFDSPLRCAHPPRWSSGGASRLEILRQALAADGLVDINFLVVNAGGRSRWVSYKLRNRVSFRVYEEGFFTSIWETLLGNKDDILVYDRCGFLTYQLRMPYSFLTYPYVESAIRVTYHGDDPCNCSIGEGQTTTMAPSTVGFNHTVMLNATVQSDGFETNVTTNSSIEVDIASNVTVTDNSTTGNHSNMTEVDLEIAKKLHGHHGRRYDRTK